MSLAALLLLLSLNACKTPATCAFSTAIGNVSGDALGIALECENLDLVREDVGAWLGNNTGVCKQAEPTGPIAVVACPIVASFAKTELDRIVADNRIMKRWACKATNAKNTALAMLTTGCMALPW